MFTAFLMRLCCSPRRNARARPSRFEPQLLRLEDRNLPSTYTVLNLNDGGPGSLRAAMASGDNTIDFTSGLHGTLTLTSGELLITDSVTINGPGANRLTVSGNNASRAFEVSSGLNVNINNLTIAHGYALDQGGGILNDGSNLTLSGDNITQNVAIESAAIYALGGGIQNLAGALTITGCVIAGNQALGASGASEAGAAGGGGVNLSAGSVVVSDSAIVGNLAQGASNDSSGASFGGGLDVFDPVSSVVISNCVMIGNLAVAGANSPFNAAAGGAIELSNIGNISNTVFTANSAIGGNGGIGGFCGEAQGGGIASFGPNGVGDVGTLTISGCTFDQNVASAGNGGNSGPGAADGSPGIGGGVYTLGTFSDDASTVIAGNHASTRDNDFGP